MTDTPRTQDELLTIFEDGQTSGISAQDMRDFVVSALLLDKDEAVSIYCYSQSIPFPTGTSIIFPYDVTNAMLSGTIGVQRTLVDPHGYVTTGADDPEPYNGYTGGFYLKGLPPGSVWATQLQLSVTRGTFVDTDDVQVIGGFALPDYEFPVDPADDTAQGIFGFPTYAYGAIKAEYFGAASGHNFYTGIAPLPLYRDDRFDLWNFGPAAAYQHSGAVQTITAFEVDFWRIR